MKTFICLTILFLTVTCVSANAQSVQLYLAIIKDKNNSRHKGILQRVDSSTVIINSEKGIEAIPFQFIKSIKIRVPKKSYEIKNFTPNTNKNTKYKLNGEGKFVDEWGNEEPSLTDIKDNVIASMLGNLLINSAALPFSKINPSVSKFKIDYDKTKFTSQLNELSYYSIYYQVNPDVSTELRKLKEMSLKFKQ